MEVECVGTVGFGVLVEDLVKSTSLLVASAGLQSTRMRLCKHYCHLHPILKYWDVAQWQSTGSYNQTAGVRFQRTACFFFLQQKV